jgi:hypothetical protein
MAIYAIIENGAVINTIVWSGPTGSADDWTPPTGSTVVIIPNGTVAGIDYTYDATSKAFTAPTETTSTGS